MNAELWRQIIIPLESQHTYNNPFLDVSIIAKFTSPSGACICREAYWDGANQYKISFAPTELGEWNYTIQAPEETGLNGQEGIITATAYSGSLPIFQNGFLKIQKGSHFITYDNGKAFFWLGDTHWDFAARERFEESNHPEMNSMFCGMADRRAKQGYTIYQTNLRSEANEAGISLYWDSSSESDLPNIDFYQNELDRRMLYLADLGFVNALGLAWFDGIGANGELLEHNKNLARYIVARYGALPIVWTLCGEVAGYAPGPMRDMYLSKWREVALYIESLDGYNQLQTAHAWSELPYADYYEKEDWFDFTLNQAGHGNLDINYRNFRDWMQEHPNKPFVEGEAMYEGCSTLETNGPRLCDDAIVRRTAYTAIQCGACGYTYGAQGIWDSVWDKADFRPWAPVFNRFGRTWTEAIDAPGGYQMGIMKDFYISHNFQEMQPDIDEARSAGFGSAQQPLVTVNKERSMFIIYFSNSPVGSCVLNNMNDYPYTIKWFNPRTGEYEETDTITPVDGHWESPFPRDFNDWIMVVEKK